MGAERIALYGNFGSGNLGNECTLRVVAQWMRRRRPDAELLCICTVPEDVRACHRLPAVPAALDERAREAPRMRSRALRWILHRAPRELIHWARCFRALRRADTLVVAGTGIVSDHLCGPGGWPYDLFKWSTLAALRRVDLVFLSIGVGPVRHPLSRWFIRRSLRRARYRSYRDEPSRRCAAEIGVPTDGDDVCPDLVFGLSARDLGEPAACSPGSRVVGLGIKDYDGVSGSNAATSAYRDYIAAMADFGCWLQHQGYRIRLLVGDLRYDARARRDLLEMLRRRALATEPPALFVERLASVEDLLREIRATDMVVSPRLHNLVLALMLEKPVIALSDHAKLDALVEGVGLADYRVSLEHLDARRLIDRFLRLEADAPRLRPHLRRQAQRNREALEEQYERLFAARSPGR